MGGWVLDKGREGCITLGGGGWFGGRVDQDEGREGGGEGGGNGGETDPK